MKLGKKVFNLSRVNLNPQPKFITLLREKEESKVEAPPGKLNAPFNFWERIPNLFSKKPGRFFTESPYSRG